MNEQPVIYDVRLRDGVSRGVDTMNDHVNHLEKSLGGVQGLLEGIGVGLLAFKGAEFVHESNEAWEKMEFSISQVEAALKSTNEAAGLSFDELKKGAEDTAHNLKFTQAEILGMQSVLLTFPSVTKATFGEASSIIQDMSTRLGQDLKSSTIQVGKALQDPERGITALRRVGVNFNETQVKTIKHLVDTNHAAEAQAMILKELAFEFGGSAQAAADADKSFRLDKTMEENKVALGELIDQIKEDLMPIFIAIANGFKEIIKWVKENKDTLAALAKGIAAAVIVFKALTFVVVPLAEGLGLVATTAPAAAAGLEATAAASTFALRPLGLVAAAIMAIVTAYNLWTDAEADRAAQEAKFNDDITKKENEAIDEMVAGLEKRGMAHEKAIEHAKQLELDLIDTTTKSTIALSNAANDRGEDIESYQTQLAILARQTQAAQGYTGANLVKAPKAKAAETLKPSKDDTKSKATAARSVTINVTIKDLIGTYNSNVTNVKTMTGEMRAAVVNALQSAVNDFQIVADRT